jgi:hypothetical protein
MPYMCSARHFRTHRPSDDAFHPAASTCSSQAGSCVTRRRLSSIVHSLLWWLPRARSTREANCSACARDQSPWQTFNTTQGNHSGTAPQICYKCPEHDASSALGIRACRISHPSVFSSSNVIDYIQWLVQDGIHLVHICFDGICYISYTC